MASGCSLEFLKEKAWAQNSYNSLLPFLSLLFPFLFFFLPSFYPLLLLSSQFFFTFHLPTPSSSGYFFCISGSLISSLVSLSISTYIITLSFYVSPFLFSEQKTLTYASTPALSIIYSIRLIISTIELGRTLDLRTNGTRVNGMKLDTFSFFAGEFS